MISVGLIGLGTVGTGIYEGLTNTEKELETAFGKKVVISKILVKECLKKRTISVPNYLLTDDKKSFLHFQFDVVFEAMGGIDPAKDYVSYFLGKGIPVITANKELVANYGAELEVLAKENNTFFGFEGAVAGGVPIINVLRSNLQWSSIERVFGIINGTTNYILTEMNEKGRDFKDVLRETQELGYAEADPTDDIEAYDAWYKIRILSRLCFGVWPNAKDFLRIGISNIEDWHVRIAKELGLTLKLIAEAGFRDDKVTGFVAPCFLAEDHPLRYINGVTNAVGLTSDPIGELILSGPGAGKGPTSASMIEDFIHLSAKKDFFFPEKRRKPLKDEEKQILLLIENDNIEELNLVMEKVDYKTISVHEYMNKKGWIIKISNNEWKKVEPYINTHWYLIFGELKLSLEVMGSNYKE
jgi:homoserine dehydrogenase